jgi:hypothetical protein
VARGNLPNPTERLDRRRLLAAALTAAACAGVGAPTTEGGGNNSRSAPPATGQSHRGLESRPHLGTPARTDARREWAAHG